MSVDVNIEKWNALPEAYKQAFEAAAAEANVNMLAAYDHKNPIALKHLIDAGVQLHAFPQDMMAAAKKAAFELYKD